MITVNQKTEAQWKDLGRGYAELCIGDTPVTNDVLFDVVHDAALNGLMDEGIGWADAKRLALEIATEFSAP